MLEELRELYQDVILDHGRSPRNFRRLEHATCDAVGHNPMCGDAIHVYLLIDGKGSIADVAFEGKGCAISMASASMMTEILRGKSVAEAGRLFEVLHGLCTREEFDPASTGTVDADALERLQVLAGVRGFPVRVKCATLAWHTMKAALAGEMQASTE